MISWEPYTRERGHMICTLTLDMGQPSPYLIEHMEDIDIGPEKAQIELLLRGKESS